MERAFGGTLLQDLSIAGAVLNMMDHPRHALIRRLVSTGLTPRMVGRVDFVVDVAAELPMQMICILLGVPESQRHWLFDAIEPSFDFGGSRKASITRLSVDDPAAPSLSDTQLSVAVEEMVRWSSPSPSKRRTATRDAELAGCRIAAGQKVLVWEGSANRDAVAFEQPDRFEVTRKPSPHLGFGQGIHYCLGANLVRLELWVLFAELLSRFSTVSVVEPVEWTRSKPPHRCPAPDGRT